MSVSITPSKTLATTLLAWQDVLNANDAIGTAVDVSAKYAAMLAVSIARKSGTAFTAGWPNIRIEGSPKSSGNDSWKTLVQFQPALGSSIANTTLSSVVAAGASTFAVAAATNISAGDLLFLADGSTANYEIVRVKSISGTTVTPEENVTYGHQSASIVTDQAETYGPTIDLSSVARVRAFVDNANSGQTIAVQILMTTLDSHTVA